MQLRQALTLVSDIHAHLARTEVFRGYRSATVGLTGVVGLLAAVVQMCWISQPTARLSDYLTLWIGAAVVNVVVVGAEIWSRARMARTAVARRATVATIEQFVPTFIAGALLTIIIVDRAADSAWMLPGLWAILFSVGIFASCRFLPRPLYLVGVWYLTAGAFALAWGRGAASLSPWSMGISFGIGQLLAATLLYFTLERFAEQTD